MDSPAETTPLLDEARAAFVQRHTSISVAARDAQLRPAVARAYGCRVAADRRQMTVFLCAVHAGAVLQCLRQHGEIAVAVARPHTHETVQLKGPVTNIAAVSAADREAMLAYRESFVEELASLGYTAEFVRGMFPGGDDCYAVTFAPTALFDQTPGPQAGRKLA